MIYRVLYIPGGAGFLPSTVGSFFSFVPHHSWVWKLARHSLTAHISNLDGNMFHESGQIIIFHQPRFPWNKGISLTKPPPFGVRDPCEVAIIWPDESRLGNFPRRVSGTRTFNDVLGPSKQKLKTFWMVGVVNSSEKMNPACKLQI